MWTIHLTKEAGKDAKRLKEAGLDAKAKFLLAIIRENPYQNPPPYEKLQGCNPPEYSRRINIKHRLHYMVVEESKTIYIFHMWSHYGE